MCALDRAQGLLRMARYESGLMESEAPIDRVAVVAEVEQLMATVSALAT
jgi:hypothetical protein